MKRIAFVIRSLKFGGAERVLVEICTALFKRGYKITIFTFNVEENEYKLQQGIERINLNIRGDSLKHFFSNISTLRQAILKYNPEVCVAFDTMINIYTVLALLKTSVKTYISERNAPGHIKLGIHSKIARKIIYCMSDYYIFQTREAAEFYSKSIQNRAFIIPNPVKAGLPEKKNYSKTGKIVAVGRLEEQKNYPMLLNAFSVFLNTYPDYVLHIYGEGKEKDNLLLICQELNIAEKVIFEGVSSDIHNSLVDYDFFVMTSWFEGMPNALMEAMAMGLPVISTNCPSGGPKLLIEDGTNGSLVGNNNVSELAKSMEKISENVQFAIKIGTNAKKVKEDFNIEKICDLWECALNSAG